MKTVRQILGPVVFWLSYPIVWIYLRIGSRSRVLIIVDGSVLLVKGWLGLGQWSLPGGGLHKGEEPALGAAREVKEELGITIPNRQLHKMYEAVAQHYGLKFRYTCFSVTLTERPQLRRQPIEIAETAWLELASITPDMVTTDTYQAVQAWLK